MKSKRCRSCKGKGRISVRKFGKMHCQSCGTNGYMWMTCAFCNGKGIRQSYSYIDCSYCDGCGTIEGGRCLLTTCNKCNGRGRLKVIH